MDGVALLPVYQIDKSGLDLRQPSLDRSITSAKDAMLTEQPASVHISPPSGKGGGGYEPWAWLGPDLLMKGGEHEQANATLYDKESIE